MNTVPFTLNETYQGFAKGHGLIRDDGGTLCLEYQVQDTVVGLIKSGVKQVRIPMSDLASVRLEKGWFGMSATLVIQAARMDAVRDVPGAKAGRLELKIARKDRSAAAKFVDDLHVPENQDR